MTSSVNSVSANNPQLVVPSSSTTSEDEKDTVKKKKTQLVSQMEGNYFCTYLIDENGNKRLLNRIPAAQAEKQASTNDALAFEKLKNSVYHKVDDSTNLECKQQATMEATNKINTQGMMDILKFYAGLPNELVCKHNLKG